MSNGLQWHHPTQHTLAELDQDALLAYWRGKISNILPFCVVKEQYDGSFLATFPVANQGVSLARISLTQRLLTILNFAW
jgi:hypothetical protein